MSQAGIASLTKSMPSVATSYVCDTGSAVPVLNTLNVLGSTGIVTSASSNNVNIALQTATVTLTSSEIKALQTTPITLVAAQGVGTMIIPYAISSKFTYGGTDPFTGGSTIRLSYYDGVSYLSFSHVLSNPLLQGTSTVYGLELGTSTFKTTGALSNLPVTIDTGGFGSYTGNSTNDNTLTVQIAYYVTTL